MGVRILAIFKSGMKNPPTHQFFETDDELLDAAQTYDGLGKNVYHACAAYHQPTNRRGDNVQAIKSLWLDLDVGEGKPYATQKEAAQHFEQFRVALGLPLTHVVSSGNGVHEYLPFTQPIPPAKWYRIASLFAQCLDHFGVKHDPSRTEDKASILRIPGTHNYKTDPAKNVTLKRTGEEVPVADLWAKLKAYADANGIFFEAKPPKGKLLETNDLIGNRLNYPPSVGEVVAENCEVLRDVAESGGHCSYNTWWKAMGVAKHTTQPEAVAVFWTRNREGTEHDKFDAIKAINEWGAGPTTCVKFAEDAEAAEKCGDCRFSGKITSPIQLGTPEEVEVTTLGEVKKAQEPPGEWTFGAPWILARIAVETRISVTKGEGIRKMTRRVKQPEGHYKDEPFCDRYWQVMRRVRTADNIWQLEIAYEQYPNKPPKTFLFDSADVMSADKLRAAFSARELHIYGGKAAMEKTQHLTRYLQSLQYTHQQETLTYPTMGWATENNSMKGELTGEFILGDMVYRPKEEPKKVLLADTVDVTLRGDFTTKGTIDEWVALVDRIYNRPGVELYQLTVMNAFASPLVRLMGGEGNWHGIPLALGGQSGAAKTSTALVGLSVYAPPSVLAFNAGEKQGDTINALSIKLGSLRNLPYLLDETTNSSADRISELMFMTANGKSKDRMGTNGKMIPNPYRWDCCGYMTSNDSQHEVMSNLKNSNTADAGKLRVFETSFKKGALEKLFKDVDRTVVEDDLLKKQYGTVGRKWIQFLVNNRFRIEKMLEQRRAEYKISTDDTSEIRFYKDLLVTIAVASELAYANGFIRWDVKKMIKWAEGQLITLNQGVQEKDWDGNISDFIASLYGRTIVTQHMKLGPGKRTSSPEIPMDDLRHAAVARKAIVDRRFVVVASYLRDWAHNARIQPSTMLAEMVNRGFMLGVAGEKVQTRLINIGSATSVPRSQAPCYELDYAKVMEFDSDGSIDMSNVVLMPVATSLVTAGAAEVGEATVSAESNVLQGPL